jgi:hypothetical protein
MFNTQQLAYMRVLASQSVGSAQVGFDRTRLLVRIGATDEEWAVPLLFLCGLGSFLLLGLFIAYLHTMRGLAGAMLLGMAGLYWAAQRVLASRDRAQQRPPSFIFDSTQHCFFVLADRPRGEPASYDRYPSHLLLGSRVRILSSTQYFDDTVIEFTFDNRHWVKALELNNSPLAYELERAIRYCQAMRP